MKINVHITLMLSILVYFLGVYLVSKIKFLDKYNIPAPVVGGLLFSIATLSMYMITSIELDFAMGLRNELLIIFFTCVGLNSKVSELKKGGKAIFIMVVIVLGCLFAQDSLGGLVAFILGEPAELGVIAGSISLSGGHGTAIAWSSVLSNEYGISNAQEIGVSCATIGLILGGLLGTPLGRLLVLKNRLASFVSDKQNRKEVQKKVNKITANSFLRVLLLVSISIMIGELFQYLFQFMGLLIPQFVGCLFGGIIVTNIREIVIKDVDEKGLINNTLVLVSSVSLNVFLSMSLMALQLWGLVELALPVIVILIVQVIIVYSFARFIVFPVLGRNYDSALMAAGFVGMALGATPTAITNIDSLEQKYGYSKTAMVVVPIIGAFFIDILNVFVISVSFHVFSMF